MKSLQLFKVRQHFPREPILDLVHAICTLPGWQRLSLRPGARIAVAVGSRGIAHHSRVVRTTIEVLRAKGAQPFIVPAMGSHGGATAEGQLEVLASFGITPESCGCPIRSSMEVVSLPGGNADVELFMDRHAYAADGIVLINRIKPHTDFHARYESGLVKMAVIGLGKASQASAIHRLGVRGLKELVPRAAKEILALGKIVLGIGIVENAYDEIMKVEALGPDEILEREPALLELARQNMPRLPVGKLDVLMVDRLGKNISGTGLDTNVIGRIRIRGEPEPESPDISSIVVNDLTDESHGNATGTGLADVITRRLFDKINFVVTNTNIFTSTFLERGKIPVVADTDEQALEYALRACSPLAGETPRLIRIRDTLHLSELYLSAALLPEIAARPDVEVLGPAVEQFDANGQLLAF